MGMKVFVKAQSMIRPLICVPKSNLMTSFTSMTVLSPPPGRVRYILRATS